MCVFIVIGGMRWMGYFADPNEKSTLRGMLAFFSVFWHQHSLTFSLSLSIYLSIYLYLFLHLSISPFLVSSRDPYCFLISTLSSWQAETLVKDQAAQLLRRCGMADKLQRWNEYKRAYPNATATGTATGNGTDGTVPPLSSIEGMDAASMAVAFKAFYAAVFALGAMLTPQCERYAKQTRT